jgi:LysM repeat protein
MAATPTVAIQAQANREPSSGGEQQGAPPKYISVKRGDTLWNIAQKYRVKVEHLRRLNQLTDNRIVIGQALWLSEDRAMEEVGADKGASTP